MSVLIDPPTWPAHGTVFAHLVSDSSLEELHQVAETAGVHPRAFDRDHYDVPARLVEACVAAGAQPVSARELVQALRASGLRRTKAMARAEATARRERLLARWPLSDQRVAVDLLDRWGARGRYYHDLRHLEHCLSSAMTLTRQDAVESQSGPSIGSVPGHSNDPSADHLPLEVDLAIWFHDAVYDGVAGEDEEQSALLAEQRLAGLLPTGQVKEVARLVRLTAGHAAVDGDDNGALMCDADLAILGSEPERYQTYRRDVRREYGDVPAPDYRRGRIAVLDHLSALTPLYRTPTANTHWTTRALANMAGERAALPDDPSAQLGSAC